jgi:hypothetical protein
MILRRLNERKTDLHWRRVASVAGAFLCLAALSIGCRATAPSAGTLPSAAASIRSKLLSMPKAATPTVSVILGWDALSDPRVAGYLLFQGVASAVYTNMLDAGLATNATLTNLPAGLTNFFAAKSYDSHGQQSVFSDEVAYLTPTPPPPPLNLTVIGVTIQASADLQSWSNAAVLQAMTFTNPPGAPQQFYRGLLGITRSNL